MASAQLRDLQYRDFLEYIEEISEAESDSSVTPNLNWITAPHTDPIQHNIVHSSGTEKPVQKVAKIRITQSSVQSRKRLQQRRRRERELRKLRQQQERRLHRFQQTFEKRLADLQVSVEKVSSTLATFLSEH